MNGRATDGGNSVPVERHTPEELLGVLNQIERLHAPEALFTSGRIELLRTPRVSVVGSREASPLGLKRAETLARPLVAQGITGISGLAKGVDAAAHRAAIAAGGQTIAVLGTPLEARPYPAENADLQRRLMRDYLVVSQFPAGTRVYRSSFVIRNRTMALLTNASVIVEAGESSGTLSQGWETLRLGRPLFLMKSILEKGLKWPDEMVKYGAAILEDADEIFDVIPPASTGPVEQLAF